jgi:isopenicillin-N N-acyltransferase-like protein
MLQPVHELYPWAGSMPALHLEGSPHQIGERHGRACGSWIRLIADYYWQVLRDPPCTIPHCDILDGIREIEALIVEYTGQAYLEEMRGIADGAGLTYDDVLVVNCAYDLMVSRSDPAVRAAQFARFERVAPRCSSFIAWGRATERAKLICTHNDDGPRYPGQFQVAKIVRPEEGLAFISPSMVGRLGQHSMMNSKGLLVVGTALDNGTKRKAEGTGLPLSVIFRFITQHCSTTAEAVRTLASFPLMVAGNFVFADPNRDVELIQATPHFSVSVGPDPQKDYLHVTNHALVEEIKPYLSLRPTGSTHYRYQTLGMDLDAEYGHINAQVAKRIMSSHYDWSVQDTRPCENSLCRHHEYKGEWGGTNRCSVWDLDDLTLEVALGNPCRGEWLSVSDML